ncbi:MAG TPA: hypothetical protein VFZ21_01185 [Gemmatimonadaceae bacterium]|nr:hypothetical protein [Gemmatimonadaceae bacterium]
MMTHRTIGSLAATMTAALAPGACAERLTTHVAREPRAVSAVPQPASAILSQRWMFAQGQLTSLQLD